MSRLVKRLWSKTKLTDHITMQVYSACFVTALLYDNETWTLYMHWKSWLASFHMQSLRRIFNLPWRTKYPTTASLNVWEYQACSHCSHSITWDALDMFIMCMMKEYLKHPEWLTGIRQEAKWPPTWYKDVCKWDLKTCSIDVNTWEAKAQNCNCWKQELRYGLKRSEQNVKHLVKQNTAEERVKEKL